MSRMPAGAGRGGGKDCGEQGSGFSVDALVHSGIFVCRCYLIRTIRETEGTLFLSSTKSM